MFGSAKTYMCSTEVAFLEGHKNQLCETFECGVEEQDLFDQNQFQLVKLLQVGKSMVW